MAIGSHLGAEGLGATVGQTQDPSAQDHSQTMQSTKEMGRRMVLPWDQYHFKGTSAAAYAEKTSANTRSHDESVQEHTQNGSGRAPKVEKVRRNDFGNDQRAITAAENQNKEVECFKYPIMAQQNERRGGGRTDRMSV